MNYQIDIQHASEETSPVSDETLTHWAQLTLSKHIDSAELTLRIVAIEEMIHLNDTYRSQNKATNVLSFPSSIPDHIPLESPFLGDVIICPNVLIQESLEQNKPLNAHWAHIVVHGILHLLGFDHVEDQDALKMQGHEIELLQQLGFDNPYQTEEQHVE